jgi:hypothetical protein
MQYHALGQGSVFITCRLHLALSNNALEPSLEPLDGIILADLVTPADLRLRPSPSRNPSARPSHTAVEVHSVDTDRRVVLDAQVNVLGDAKAKVARLGEVPLAQFVFLDLEAAFEDFFGLGASDGDVHGDLFVTADAEGADGVACFACGDASGKIQINWGRKGGEAIL